MNACDKFLPLKKFQGLNLPVLFCPEGFLVETIVSKTLELHQRFSNLS